jgi:hypothetical protein
MDRWCAALPQAPMDGLFSWAAAWGVKGGKSFACRFKAGSFPLRDWLLPFALLDGEMGRLACREPGVSRPARFGCALRPTAQSGRGGKGC